MLQTNPHPQSHHKMWLLPQGFLTKELPEGFAETWLLHFADVLYDWMHMDRLDQLRLEKEDRLDR